MPFTENYNAFFIVLIMYIKKEYIVQPGDGKGFFINFQNMLWTKKSREPTYCIVNDQEIIKCIKR